MRCVIRLAANANANANANRLDRLGARIAKLAIVGCPPILANSLDLAVSSIGARVDAARRPAACARRPGPAVPVRAAATARGSCQAQRERVLLSYYCRPRRARAARRRARLDHARSREVASRRRRASLLRQPRAPRRTALHAVSACPVRRRPSSPHVCNAMQPTTTRRLETHQTRRRPATQRRAS